MARHLLGLLLLVPALAGCDFYGTELMCANDVIRTLMAPAGDHKAILFQRDCGATTGFSSQVSILTAGETLKGSGNTFVADTGHGAAPAAQWGGPRVELEWASERELVISYDRTARIFKSRARVNSVHVTYAFLEGGLAEPSKPR